MGRKSERRNPIDPWWTRKYPRFPGVAECVRLLKAGNVSGMQVETIFGELAEHAGECLPELIAVFRSDEVASIRGEILGVIAEARLPAAIPFLADVVREGDPEFVETATEGLLAIGTREARTALWAARHGEQGTGGN